jgi:hypothetical protein
MARERRGPAEEAVAAGPVTAEGEQARQKTRQEGAVGAEEPSQTVKEE